MIQSSRLQQRKLQHGKEMVIAVKKSSKKELAVSHSALVLSENNKTNFFPAEKTKEGTCTAVHNRFYVTLSR